MSAWVRAAGFGLLAASAPLGPLGVTPVAGQTTIDRMTSDTPEYCSHLLALLHETTSKRPPPQEVMALSSEGELMCDHGETRRGVLRLRRAMRIMMGRAD